MSESGAESFDNGQKDVNAVSVKETSITLIILEVLVWWQSHAAFCMTKLKL
jgi:hypothetical protein